MNRHRRSEFEQALDLLAYLERYKGWAISRVAALAGIGNAPAKAYLDILEARGYISKTTFGKRRTYSLTREGKELISLYKSVVPLIKKLQEV